MRLEDMKNEIPETPAFIHEMIQQEVSRQLQDDTIIPVNKKRRRTWSRSKAAAVAVICAAGISTSVYAGTRLYHLYMEKHGNYGISIGITGESDNETGDLPEEIHGITLTANYIPDGMVWESSGLLRYPDHDGYDFSDGISISSVFLDSGDLNKVAEDTRVIYSEARTFGGYEGVYLQYDTTLETKSYNQRIYLLCPDLHRVVIAGIGQDVTREDAIKVMENLLITENDMVITTANLPTWSDYAVSEDTDAQKSAASVSENELSIHAIAASFPLSVHYENAENLFIDNTIAAVVNSVQLSDSLELLNPDQVPAQWADTVNQDGTLKDNNLSYIALGDGINTLDTVVDTKTERQKLVYVTITYTNTTAEEITNLSINSCLLLLNQTDGKYQIYHPVMKAGDNYDIITGDGAASNVESADALYTSVLSGNGETSVISSIPAGQSVKVAAAWIVNESDLDHMYLDLTGSGSSFTFTDAILSTGLTDIRQ